MTNLEYVMQNPELEKMIIMGGLASVNGEPCNCDDVKIGDHIISGTPCELCDFHKMKFKNSKTCMDIRNEYSNSEYKPTPKLSKREKCFLDALLPSISYIVRNMHGDLLTYTVTPIKSSIGWTTDAYVPKPGIISTTLFGDIFSFIKCDDLKPTSVEWLKRLDVE